MRRRGFSSVAGRGERRVERSVRLAPCAAGMSHSSRTQPTVRLPIPPSQEVPAMAEMIIESPDEVVAFLKAQHNLIEDMFDQVLHATDPKAREEPFTTLRQLLAVHETAEEMVVHPRVRREDDDAGDAIVDARL